MEDGASTESTVHTDLTLLCAPASVDVGSLTHAPANCQVHIMLDEPDDVQDYNIARHIVGVHQRRDLALSPPYSTDTLQRYIRFARSIKPEMTPEAQAEVVRSYVRLRTGDAHGGQTAYRITVRQLEALVRLSEALARLHNDSAVRTAHVREAKRLLGNSIISVESQDVSLAGFEEEDGPFDDADAPDAPGGGGGDDDDDQASWTLDPRLARAEAPLWRRLGRRLSR